MDITGELLNSLLKEALVLRCQVLNYILSFSLVCRAPNPDNGLIIQTPSGVFSAKSLVQNKKRGGSRLISSIREEDEESPTEDTVTCDPFSAARCRVFKRKINSKKVYFGSYPQKVNIFHCASPLFTRLILVFVEE